MVKNPEDFYNKTLAEYRQELALIRKRLFMSSMLRLTVFVLGALSVYFVFGNSQEMIGIVIVSILIFSYLISRHNKLKYKRDLVQAIIQQNEVELDVLNRRFHQLPDGAKYIDPTHAFSQDIDLFGRGSFYQYLNRAATEKGADYLASLLTENSILGIPKKQKAIKELADLPQWRQQFSAIGSLVKSEVSSDLATTWIADYKAFIPEIMRFLPTVFSLISLGLMVSNYFGWLPIGVTVGWFFVGWIVHSRFVKRIGTLGEKASEVQGVFQQYSELLVQIETQEFLSDLLSEKRQAVMESGIKASAQVRKFARFLDALEQGNIMLFGALANGFMLRDLRQCYYIEKWIAENKNHVQGWFDAIASFDAYNSLGNFSFNHPHYVFPEITDVGAILDVQGAGHPLLRESVMVRNDFRIPCKDFHIITGANMAGKSTFLRTVSLQIVMANVGLPVCAKKSVYRPIKLITSMRTTDSLTDDESYFFSELKRLKFIVDKIESDQYFIILDEILKGTNSKDKAIGSRKFIEKLVASESTGIIATHDLSLCEVANEKPQVKNYYFDVQIRNDELLFDYTLKPGICQNMNASFLLRKMNIID